MSIARSSTGGSAHAASLPASGDSAEGTPEGSPRPPVLDLSALKELEEDLGGAGVAHEFAADYIGIWDKRLTYLGRSLEGDDPEPAMDALTSIRISAFMVGAFRLAGLAVEAECLLRSGNLTAVRQLLPVLAQTGAETVRELKTRYL